MTSFNTKTMKSLETVQKVAAKVNAQLIAKGCLNSSYGNSKSTDGFSANKGSGKHNLLVTEEVVINDVSMTARNHLTRTSTQDEINKMSGAYVSTRGRYLPASEIAKLPPNPPTNQRPLYLHIQGATQQDVKVAVGRIMHIILEHNHSSKRPNAPSNESNVGQKRNKGAHQNRGMSSIDLERGREKSSSVQSHRTIEGNKWNNDNRGDQKHKHNSFMDAQMKQADFSSMNESNKAIKHHSNHGVGNSKMLAPDHKLKSDHESSSNNVTPMMDLPLLSVPPPSNYMPVSQTLAPPAAPTAPMLREKVFLPEVSSLKASELYDALLGEDDSNLRYIREQTGVTVLLRGLEASNGQCDEPLHFYVEHSNQAKFEEAKSLLVNLAQTVITELHNAKLAQQATTPLYHHPPPPNIVSNTTAVAQHPGYDHQVPLMMQQAPNTSSVASIIDTQQQSLTTPSPATAINYPPPPIISVPPPPQATHPIQQQMLIVSEPTTTHHHLLPPSSQQQQQPVVTSSSTTFIVNSGGATMQGTPSEQKAMLGAAAAAAAQMVNLSEGGICLVAGLQGAPQVTTHHQHIAAPYSNPLVIQHTPSSVESQLKLLQPNIVSINNTSLASNSSVIYTAASTAAQTVTAVGATQSSQGNQILTPSVTGCTGGLLSSNNATLVPSSASSIVLPCSTSSYPTPPPQHHLQQQTSAPLLITHHHLPPPASSVASSSEQLVSASIVPAASAHLQQHQQLTGEPHQQHTALQLLISQQHQAPTETNQQLMHHTMQQQLHIQQLQQTQQQQQIAVEQKSVEERAYEQQQQQQQQYNITPQYQTSTHEHQLRAVVPHSIYSVPPTVYQQQPVTSTASAQLYHEEQQANVYDLDAAHRQTMYSRDSEHHSGIVTSQEHQQTSAATTTYTDRGYDSRDNSDTPAERCIPCSSSSGSSSIYQSAAQSVAGSSTHMGYNRVEPGYSKGSIEDSIAHPDGSKSEGSLYQQQQSSSSYMNQQHPQSTSNHDNKATCNLQGEAESQSPYYSKTSRNDGNDWSVGRAHKKPDSNVSMQGNNKRPFAARLSRGGPPPRGRGGYNPRRSNPYSSIGPMKGRKF